MSKKVRGKWFPKGQQVLSRYIQISAHDPQAGKGIASLTKFFKKKEDV